jgi:thiamine-monophosphate kinase
MTELEIIRHIDSLFRAVPNQGFDDRGDDCTSLDVGNGELLLFSTDLLTEGVHFLRHLTPPYELGRKALAVNLSDVAAMGGRAIATLLSIAIPKEVDAQWCREFLRGYRDLSQEESVALVGGDTTAAQGGVSINVTVIGRVASAHIKRRSSAQPNDAIVVSGALGASAVGLRELLAGETDGVHVRAHNTPKAQTEVGLWLGTRDEVHAMMDLSDGLAADLPHILQLSHVGARIQTEQIPLGEGVDIRTAVCGGEDYQLLFTVADTAVDDLCNAFEQRFGRACSVVGHITALQEAELPVIQWYDKEQPIYPDWHGYEHLTEK